MKRKKHKIEYRRIIETAIQEFKNKFNNQPILDAETFKEAVYQLNNQWKILKNRERKWLTYKTQDLWHSYKRKRNRYTTMLKFKKRHSLFTLIEENSKYTKKLYKLVNHLTGQKEENPLPEENDDTKLAEQFREFFLNKIINIRKLFHNIPP